jgi:integrase/recombinase XerD
MGTPKLDLLQGDLAGFVAYLNRKQLSNKSITAYVGYYNKLVFPLTQESVNSFLNKYNISIPRAMLKSLLEYLNISNIKIPKITGTKKKKKMFKVITKQEVYAVMKGMPNIMYKLMVLLSFQGGFRLQELLDLKPFNVRWNKWREDMDKPGHVRIEQGKGNKGRVVFLTPKVMVALHNFIMKYRSTDEKEAPVFPIHRNTWQKKVESVSIKVLGYSISPHVFRHSCATYLLNVLHWNPMQVKEYMGHESLETTQLYLHSNQDNMEASFTA